VSKKKHILQNELNTDYYIYGIASSDAEFQLSLKLNALLSVKLTLDQPVKKEHKGNSLNFPTLRYLDEQELQISLIKNKHNNSILFSNQQAFDYILIFTGFEAQKTAASLISNVKKLENITLASPIDISKLSSFKSILK
jgi:hypothetical protein